MFETVQSQQGERAPKPAHPSGADLEAFLRGSLPEAEVATIVRHLLAGCPACRRVTRRLWRLGEWGNERG